MMKEIKKILKEDMISDMINQLELRATEKYIEFLIKELEEQLALDDDIMNIPFSEMCKESWEEHIG